MSKKVTPVEDELSPQDVTEPDIALSGDELIGRATADRSAGRDTTQSVKALVKLAAKRNQAALDRLAK